MFPVQNGKFSRMKPIKKTETSSAKVKSKVKADEIPNDNNNNGIDDRIEEAINEAGYSYDPKQDIFYSNTNPWQKGMGYCRLYDEAAVPMGMVIDCEPIYFKYNGKRWLIEFWKGQYDMTTGCEVGVYSTDQPDIIIPGLFSGPFFRSPSEDEHLQISFSLIKKGKTLFTRNDKHWWLTGFKLGEFSNPSELIMDIKINLRDEIMLNEFVKGLKNAGYSNNEIVINGTAVKLRFNKTHTPQPLSRTPEADLLMQWKNKLLCDKFMEITAPYKTFPDKMKAILKQAPELYDKIIKIVKTKHYFGKFEKLIEYYI